MAGETATGPIVSVSGAGWEDFLVYLGDEAPSPLREARLERYIGVSYRPETERLSHYFATCIADEYDVLIHLGTTARAATGSGFSPVDPSTCQRFKPPDPPGTRLPIPATTGFGGRS